MDFALGPEQELIRRSTREFCEREVLPNARDWDRAETMDRGIVAKLADAGLLGCGLPEAYGGMGLDTVSYCLVMEELGRADSSVRGIVSVNNGLAGKTIARWGSEEQKREWLPKLCSGEALGCYGLTEPGSGSDPASLVTRAERDGDDWVLRLMAWRAAALADAGESYTLAASQAKYYASEVAVRAANAALQVHGGYGYVDEFPVAKYLRDARVLTLYEGTSQVQKLLIGRALTGESAFV